MTGWGRLHPPLMQLVPWANLFTIGPLGEQTAQVLANDCYLGGYPPPVTQIPLSWIAAPIRFRQDPPRAVAEVTQDGGQTARSENETATGNRQWVFTAGIDSAASGDPASLAKWVTDYYTDPLPRSNALTLALNERTTTELWRILGVRQGARISITGAPAAWPDGATELIVEGIQHKITADRRAVTWLTSPVIGEVAGEAGPWFYLGDSVTSGTDVVPY